MNIPKYIEEEIKSGRMELIKNALQMKNYYQYTFRLFSIPCDEKTKGRSIEKTIDIANKIVSFAKRNGAVAELGEVDYCYQSKLTHSPYGGGKWGWYEKIEYIQIGITDPVCKVIEDIIEEQKEANYFKKKTIRISERSIIDFKNASDKDFETKNKIGHIRADHDKYQWHGTWWNGDVDRTEEVYKESQFVYDNLTKRYPNGVVSIQSDIYEFTERLSECEGNIYYEGEYADYWIRLIARQGDYNMYINCYEK